MIQEAGSGPGPTRCGYRACPLLIWLIAKSRLSSAGLAGVPMGLVREIFLAGKDNQRQVLESEPGWIYFGEPDPTPCGYDSCPFVNYCIIRPILLEEAHGTVAMVDLYFANKKKGHRIKEKV